MKKISKSRIFLIVICAIVFTSIGVLASNLNASEIDYKDTTVEGAIDDLYTSVNRDITFGSMQVNRSFGYQAASGDRTVDLTLNRGKYLVNFIWSNSHTTSANTDERANAMNSSICSSNLSCTNNCDITGLGGQYSVSHNDDVDSNNVYKVNIVVTCSYYVNITTDNTTLTGASMSWGHSQNKSMTENLLINATPVNK